MEGNRLQELLSAQSLIDVVSDAVELKQEVENVNNDDTQDFHTVSDDFFDAPIIEEAAPEEEFEDKKPYDAEANGKTLVYALQAVEGLILPTVAFAKVKKKAGGKKALDKMQKAARKQASGEELSEKEIKLIESLDKYNEKIKYLQDDFLPNQQTTEQLIKTATMWCEVSRFEFGPGTAFLLQYSGELIKKVMKVATA